MARRAGINADRRRTSQPKINGHRVRDGSSSQFEQTVIFSHGRRVRDQRRQPLICGFQIRRWRPVQDRSGNGVQVNEGFLLLRLSFHSAAHSDRGKRSSCRLKLGNGILRALSAQAERHRQQSKQTETCEQSNPIRDSPRTRTFLPASKKKSVHFRLDSNTLLALIATCRGPRRRDKPIPVALLLSLLMTRNPDYPEAFVVLKSKQKGHSHHGNSKYQPAKRIPKT